MTPELQEALEERAARESWPHPRFYKPFDEGTSNMLRAYYSSQLKLPEQGDSRVLRFKSGLKCSDGYTRVVVGDYGAYVEISPDQIARHCIRDRWGPRKTPRRPIKYWWMVPVDGSDAKVYEQVRTVPYADYKPGMFYVSEEYLRL